MISILIVIIMFFNNVEAIHFYSGLNKGVVSCINNQSYGIEVIGELGFFYNNTCE